MKPYTEQELQEEYRYRVEERLGILCGDARPTPEQLKLAQDEAQATTDKLRIDSNSDLPTHNPQRG